MISNRKALTIVSALLIFATAWLVTPASAKEMSLRIDATDGATSYSGSG